MEKNKKLLILLLMVFSSIQLFSQKITVTGNVSDAKGEELIGVSVIIKGQTQLGTITDIDGNYTISANKGDVLQFSYIGFETTEKRVDGSILNVTMDMSSEMLTEVVAVGYGVQKKVDVTGAISSIKGDALVIAPTPNLSNALVGKMTGVVSTQQSGKPGLDDPTFLIRGKGTINDANALFLVDGVERSIGKLNPSDIESITVLKDAASAAVYGARAANGVVIVTTKRGTEGKTKMSFSSTVGSQRPTIVPDMMNAYEYSKYLNQARVNFGDKPLFTDKEIEGYRDGRLPSTDWWKETLKSSALMHQHNLTLNGGSKNTRFFISLGMLNQDGLYEGSGFERYNVRSNIDTDITKDFTISLDLAGRYEKIDESSVGDGLFSTIINSKPTQRAYVPNEIEPGGLGSNGQHVSPIGQALHSGYHKVTNSVFEGTLKGTYRVPFLEGLQVAGSFSYDRWFSNDKNFSTPYKFYDYEKALDLYTPRKSGGGINLYQGTAESEKITAMASLNYNARFAEVHNVSAVFVVEQSNYKESNLSAARLNYITAIMDQLQFGPDKDKTNGGAMREETRLGYVGRANYDYLGKYLFQFNFRYDGSYNFHPDRRWGFFPAVSAGWRMSEESFIKQISAIHNLKLRASYGQFGNDRIPPYQYLQGYKFGSGAVIGSDYQLGVTDWVVANPRTTWETATNLDLGLDFSFLKGTISGELTYFYKKTKDILVTREASVPSSFGGVLPSENLGKVDNKGIEAILRYTNKIGDVSFNVEGNLTWVKNKVIYIDEPEGRLPHQKAEGRPIGQFYGYKALGLFQNQAEISEWAMQDGSGNVNIKPGDIKYEDISGPDGVPDGVIDVHDQQFVGKSDIPEFIFGLNLSASYKGFDFTMNFQGATGFDQYLRWDPFNQESNALAIFKNSWSEANPSARYPRLSTGVIENNRKNSSFWLHDGTYLKLRNAELAYTFKKYDFFKKVGVEGLRVFVSGNNLLTFSKIKDFDPETPNINPDRNAYYYPQMKVYNIGFNVEF